MKSYQDYFYPGTFTLENKLEIRNPDELALAEAELSAIRQRQPIEGLELSAEGLKRIHHHLFQDVYPWAGEFRTVDMAKVTEDGKEKVDFCPGHRVKAVEVPRFFRQLNFDMNVNRSFDGLDKETFGYRSSVYLADLNYVHPFVEGNGRAQRIFLEELTRQSGYHLDHSRLDGKAWIAAAVDSYAQDTYDQYGRITPGPHEKMKALIAGAVDTPREKEEREAFEERLEEIKAERKSPPKNLGDDFGR